MEIIILHLLDASTLNRDEIEGTHTLKKIVFPLPPLCVRNPRPTVSFRPLSKSSYVSFLIRQRMLGYKREENMDSTKKQGKRIRYLQNVDLKENRWKSYVGDNGRGEGSWKLIKNEHKGWY